ncbi:glycoside hydrolase family 36 protein [Streptomyces sp. RTd22]|uniref:glycoside hydrolase family 36 protein n=1 Tax=Streptomyces sp. RTd22 TaxID=1841249 RepID=UPI000AD87359|nr:glycoside hydrolase family 36 protein [Streptomyces sp. RTd22]
MESTCPEPATPHQAMDDLDEGETAPIRFAWEPGRLALTFTAAKDRPVVLSGLGPGAAAPVTRASQPLVELIVTGDGRALNTPRFTSSGVGSRLRYVEHSTAADEDCERLHIVQADAVTGLRVTTTFTASPRIRAARVETSVRNDGAEPVVLEAISSFATGAVVAPEESTRDLVLHSGAGEQLAENRWSTRRLWSQTALADFNSALHDQPGRGGFAAVSTSTWSTVRNLPTGVLENARTGRSMAWQIEHNGGWRWEVGNVREGEDSVALVLLGPEDLDHHWSQELAPGAAFVSVPVSFAVAAAGLESVMAELTRHRRWLRRERNADRGSLLVFNDFMNTLNGDPTTDRLLPLIDAAARAGAECFCIDAGWYDDTDLHDWWPTVGEWIPSKKRFPHGGLDRVVTAIRESGMKAGLWLEPEVVGVLSPVARLLPDAAFLQRHGRRVVEQERYFLDLRHPAARAHLDAVFDRLIGAFDLGFFKLDYNVTPGSGTDRDAFSTGAGLLGHNRAHLQWVADLRGRYPHIVFENCSSGAMRADFAMLELFDFQSTSDQMDFRLYPAIAAGAPLQMLPEQAGNWAYPQAWMSDEEIAFTMVNGLSGRLYLSGFLDRMTAEQLSLVQDATALFKRIRNQIAGAVPGWPMGLPDWYADSFALALTGAERNLLYVWHRGGGAAELTMRLGPGIRAEHLVELYPRRLAPWKVTDGADGTIRLRPGIPGPSARVYEIS